MILIRKELFIFTDVHLSSDGKGKLNRIHTAFQTIRIKAPWWGSTQTFSA